MIDKKRLIRLTQKVVSIDSTNPPGKELELANFIEQDMKSLGLEVKTYSYAKGRPNIVATLKGKAPRKKAQKEALLLTPHFDTVPFGNGWKYPPLSGKIVNGKLYGRGSTDDKGNLAACMEVMRSLVEDQVPLQKDVIMAATVDEETGSHYGIVPLLKNKVLKPRFALVLDSDEFDAIIAQKGLIHCRVKIYGKKAHGAYNWRGVNAIEKASKIINTVKNIKFPYKKHPLLHGPTINVGCIKGGEKVNMVADFCEVSLDVRFLPGMDHREILNVLKDIIKKEIKTFEIDIDDVQLPYEMDRKDPFVQMYLKCAKKMGNKAIVKGSEGATVISLFEKYKIPAFATGFGAHGTAHTTDEYIFVKSLYEGTRTLEQFVKDYDQF